jgi:hypothetical protein
MIKQKNQNLIIIALAVVAFIGIFVTGTEPLWQGLRNTFIAPISYTLNFPNTILFNLFIGVLVNILFWWLIVYSPALQQRKIRKAVLNAQYVAFKKAVIEIFLSATGKQPYIEDIEDLLDHKKFKRFIHANNQHPNQTNSHAIQNGLELNAKLTNQFVFEFRLLKEEIAYTINNIEIDDENAHDALKRLSRFVLFIEHADENRSELIKQMLSFCWPIFTRFDFLTGDLKEDWLQSVIDKI